MSAFSVVIADDRPVRRSRLVAGAGAVAGAGPAVAAASLMEAYSLIESGSAQAAIVCQGWYSAPGFRMFAELARLLGVPLVALDEAVGSEAEALAELSRLAQLAQAGRPPRLLPATKVSRLPLSTREPVIVIGASTGGVEALHRLLGEFGADCPPTLIVQHIRGNFSAAFADRLNRASRPDVTEAAEGQKLARGLVLIAPGDLVHLSIDSQAMTCRLTESAPESGHRPSVDVLFRSAAALGSRTIGVLLTGMGRDGAEGLAAIRKAGGHTIAQDRTTSTVYGMPRVAAEIGAAVDVLPLDRIAQAALCAATDRFRPRSPA